MSETLRQLLLVFAAGAVVLFTTGLIIIARRWYVAQRTRRDALHVRLLRSELMQAVARGEDSFLIEHWTGRDRKAALSVSAQILGFLRGPDRRRLEDIVERNGVLKRPLARVARLRESRRIAVVRQIAAFGNKSVQATLHALLQHDPSPHVRLEAAIAILVAGNLPSPWRVVRSILSPGQRITPNHRLLFRTLAIERVEAVIAMATLQDDPVVRQLAVDALGHATDERVMATLKALGAGDGDFADAARQALASHTALTSFTGQQDYAAAATIRRLARQRLAA